MFTRSHQTPFLTRDGIKVSERDSVWNKRVGSRDRIKEQGATMMIVMMILLLSTASAAFAVHAATFEVRGAGHVRQALQTQYVAETGLMAALAYVDAIKPASLLYAMQRSDTISMGINEPALTSGKLSYRLYKDDFVSMTGLNSQPVQGYGANSTFGAGSVFDPTFTVDITDVYVYEGTLPGERADGLSKLQFMFATYTSRGRTQVSTSYSANGDFTATGDTRGYNEGAVDAQAHGISGPFAK